VLISAPRAVTEMLPKLLITHLEMFNRWGVSIAPFAQCKYASNVNTLTNYTPVN